MNPVVRKDVMENIELSRESKKALEEKQKKEAEDEKFECKEEGFSFGGNIIIMEGKKPKRKKRR